jgi:hypothetical protein
MASPFTAFEFRVPRFSVPIPVMPAIIVVFPVALRIFAIAPALFRFPLRIFTAALGVASLPFFRRGAAGEVRDENREHQKYEGPFHFASIPEKAALRQSLNRPGTLYSTRGNLRTGNH